MSDTDEVTPKASKVVVGLSGGVDSAVAAAMLQQAGYDVHGVALDLWKAPDTDNQAPAGYRAIAAHLGIPLAQQNLKTRFYHQVVEPFLDDYALGRTPNPCVFCNPTLKFKALLDHADALGAAWIATGHYARVLHDDRGVAHLLRGRAQHKDQSYALYRLTQPILRRLRLPLGNLESKDEVRRLARQWGLPSADAEDSQDLCFMQGSDYRDLLANLRPNALTPGPILDEAGRPLGEHEGLPRYTVGQRSGLGIQAAERLYVLRLDPVRNALIVGPREALARRGCTLQTMTFTTGSAPTQTFEAQGRIRYRAPLTRVSVTLDSEGSARITFDTPQYGVAPGQSLVLYDGDEVLGGGVIEADPIT